MANLAIKGHPTRGKEVIEILEMLGGKNTRDYICNIPDYAYSINEQGIIDWFMSRPNSIYTIFTLEKFLEKYPYKIEDKVKVCGDNIGVIISMRWEIDYIVYKVKLSKNGYETSKTSEKLQPYKEETMEERKYTDLRLDVDQDDKLATEATIDGDKITPPENYLIGKITKVDNGMLVEFVKKQPQYPKTYEECCKILDLPHSELTIDVPLHYSPILTSLAKLFICRYAYWKIFSEQMRLGKPWEYNTSKNEFVYAIAYQYGNIQKCEIRYKNRLLTFPTEEMRDAFYENFKDLIEACKELL